MLVNGPNGTALFSYDIGLLRQIQIFYPILQKKYFSTNAYIPASILPHPHLLQDLFVLYYLTFLNKKIWCG